MSIKRITADQIYENSMERVANRPTEASRFGRGGLTPAQLKAYQDRLALIAVEKVNEVIDAINADASAESIAAMIKTPITDPDNDVASLTLYDVLQDISSGKFVEYLKLIGFEDRTLMEELTHLEDSIKGIDKSIGDESDEEARDGSIFARLAYLYALIGIATDPASATGSLFARVNKLYNMQWGNSNIEDDAVTSPKIADGEVTTPKIADRAVTSQKIAEGAVQGTQLSNNSVSASKIADKSVGEAKLGDDVIDKLDKAIRNVNYNPQTGVLSFASATGETITVDLPLELMIKDGFYAKAHDSEREYAVGDYCTYEKGLYKSLHVQTGGFDVAGWSLVSDAAEAEREIVLEMYSGGVIEIPAKDIAGALVVDDELSETSENPVQNKIIAAALKKVSANIPVFDLSALGLPMIPSDGSMVSLETDTTEIMAALDKGAVKFIVGLNVGAETQAEVVMNKVSAEGEYICAYTLDFGAPIILTLMFAEGAIQGYLAEIASESGLPEVSAEDEGKFLCVSNGAWAAVALTDLSEEGA